MREQEWSLADRETVTFDDTVIAALARDERFDRIPPRQQRLARALAASVVDIFIVEAVHDDHMTLRSVRGGRAHRVHEHNPDARLSPGYFVIGRLIPFEQGLWLRSPGTISFAPRRPDEAAVLADALRRASAAMPLAATGTHFYRFSVDEPLAEWIGALSEQAESRSSPPATETPGSRGKSTGKQPRKRNRKRR